MQKIEWNNIKAKLVSQWLRFKYEGHPMVSFIFFVSVLFLLLNIVFFFINLNSTLSDHSWGDISCHTHNFYNFINGRPFQNSIVAAPGHGTMYNPYAYLNQAAIHVNFTPYLFTPIYFLYQNVNMSYLIVILFNYIGISIMIRKIMKYRCRHNYHISLMLALSFLFISGVFFMFIRYKAHPILFLGPFFLAMYYFLIKQQYLRYLVTTILICLISEDTAGFLVGWAIYLMLFEGGLPHKYKYSLTTLLTALFVVFMTAFIIQPAATYHLVPTSDIVYSGHTREGVFRFITIIRDNLAKPPLLSIKSFLLPLRTFIWPALFMMSLPMAYLMLPVFGYRLKVKWKKLCGLILVAPITHIGVSYFIGGGHHLMPLYICLLLSLVLLLSSGREEQEQDNTDRFDDKLFKLRGRKWPLAITVTMLLLFFVLPNGYFTGRQVAKGIRSVFESSQVKTSNISTIKYVNEIPSDAGVVFWTNRNVEAFIAARSNFWRFPRYFDKADYLVVQKNVNGSFYQISHEKGLTLLEAIDRGMGGSSGDVRSITDDDINRIRQYLVYDKKTHEIVRHDKNIIVFEKIDKETFEMPYFTIGLGWARDVPKVLERYKLW